MTLSNFALIADKSWSFAKGDKCKTYLHYCYNQTLPLSIPNLVRKRYQSNKRKLLRGLAKFNQIMAAIAQ